MREHRNNRAGKNHSEHPGRRTPAGDAAADCRGVEGYDAQTKTTYEATFLYDGYAKLEIETERPGEDREPILYGAWEGNSPNYQIKLNLGNYTLTILEEGKSAKLTTPDNRAVTLRYESF